jgi:hypothetical protein
MISSSLEAGSVSRLTLDLISLGRPCGVPGKSAFGAIQVLGDVFPPAKLGIDISARKPSRTIRIFSSAEYCFRVANVANKFAGAKYRRLPHISLRNRTGRRSIAVNCWSFLENRRKKRAPSR